MVCCPSVGPAHGRRRGVNLVSERITVDDYEDAVELFFERRWTDGLPVVLPTRRRVEAMIGHVGRDPQESLGAIPPRGGEATIETLAINAVMGGARPEHFPVVLAAMEALLDPAHNLNGVSQTTHMCVSLVIVNGPIARELEFNSRGAVPWDTDKSTLSHPAEYAFCIAEEEVDNPWPPLHVERGYPAGSDAVTVFACEGPHSVFCYGTPEEMLHVLVDSLGSLGNNNVHVLGQTLVTLNPLNAEEFARRGWSKQDVRAYLWEHTRRTLADVRACGAVHEQFRKMERDAGRYPHRYDLDNPTTRLPVTARPEDIHIIVAGGRSYFAAVLPGWGGFGGFAVTRPIRRPR